MSQDRPDDNDVDDVATERGYDGTQKPVQIEDVEHVDSPAVILGALQQDGHIIRADGVGVLIVENPGLRDGPARINH
jgi:hypothetical protein